MWNRLAVACVVAISCSSLEGSDQLLPQALGLKRLIRVLPSRHPSAVDFRSRSIRRSSNFGLKLVVASGDDLIEFLPPKRVEERPEGVFQGSEPNSGSELTPKIDDQAVFDEAPADNALPPLSTSPDPLSSPSNRSAKQAVPLDDAFRDSDKSQSEDDEKEPSPATERSSYGWLAGNQNHLGMLEFDFEPLSRVRYDAFGGEQKSRWFLDSTFGARWLNGPNSPDLPPYLFNILINVGTVTQVSDRFAFDAVISPGWYSDFSNKGVEAFRLPWHFVTYTKTSDEWQWVLGITDLSRRDIRLLPVAGFIYEPRSGNVRMDLVFPKPKIAWRAYESQSYKNGDWSIKRHEGWLYLAGELGGGSWAISRADRSYDVVTYRDYRLFAGLESKRAKGNASRIEIGWIFGRAVEYMSNLGNYNPSDSLMIRYSSDY